MNNQEGKDLNWRITTYTWIISIVWFTLNCKSCKITYITKPPNCQIGEEGYYYTVTKIPSTVGRRAKQERG